MSNSWRSVAAVPNFVLCRCSMNQHCYSKMFILHARAVCQKWTCAQHTFKNSQITLHAPLTDCFPWILSDHLWIVTVFIPSGQVRQYIHKHWYTFLACLMNFLGWTNSSLKSFISKILVWRTFWQVWVVASPYTEICLLFGNFLVRHLKTYAKLRPPCIMYRNIAYSDVLISFSRF